MSVPFSPSRIWQVPYSQVRGDPSVSDQIRAVANREGDLLSQQDSLRGMFEGMKHTMMGTLRTEVEPWATSI